MFDLRNKTAFVTGAASGIGEAIAETLSAAGAFVFVADIDRERGSSVAESLCTSGREAEFIELDVSSHEGCIRAAARVVDSRGGLDILVNNAGIGFVGTISQTDAEDLDRLYSVNVRGAFSLTKAFIGGMIERRRGVVINIASIGGVVAIADRLAYCTTKFAVVGFTKCLALDHARDGIRAVAVCPGRVETPFVRERLAEYPDPEVAYREMSATQAVGRMATPEEIAASVLYLASDEAAFVTGTAFEIDGGFSGI
ncbi:MAG: 3-oxoacyl-(acyl-carrier-protein) reductase [Acidobacteria bacterium OLB17]|nr:MAG: 3-oxoacyl-(acyl-carrier-protein) reductase [Acidobacteria bacterium OLB17]MCZ2392171.1 SDR family oxidoreductase [Acidobacteriota bacterium]